MGWCDLVVVALKATSNSSLESLVPPLLNEKTILLTLQNGLGNEEFPADRFSVLGVCFVLRLSDAAQRSERSLRSWDAFDWSFRGLNRTRGFDRGRAPQIPNQGRLSCRRQ